MRLSCRPILVAMLLTAVSPLISNVTLNAQASRLKKHKAAHARTRHAVSDPKGGKRSATVAKAAADPKGNAQSSPKVADPGKSSGEAKNADKWSETDIAAAKAHCAEILQRIDAVAIAHEPIKEGACGAAAPIELVSIGKNPEVAISPPAIVRCDLAEALVTWLERDLQPLARKHFNSKIVKIETMSSYSCRNAPRRKTTKLSEHGLANAVDIGDFVMASQKTADVRNGWGTPKREIVARIAAEKAAAEKKAAEIASANQAAQKNLSKGHSTEGASPPAAEGSTVGAPAAGIAHSHAEEGKAKLTVTLPGAVKSGRVASLSGVGSPQHSDTPHEVVTKDGAKSSSRDNRHVEAEPDPETKAFLHEAHAAACQIFGTTLGPEANADHRNHFHVDMAPRKYKKICD